MTSTPSAFNPIKQALHNVRGLDAWRAKRGRFCWTCSTDKPMKGGLVTPPILGGPRAQANSRFTCACCLDAKAKRQADL